MHPSNKREIPRVLTMWQDIQVENVMIEERGIGEESRESRPRKMVSLALQVECVWVRMRKARPRCPEQRVFLFPRKKRKKGKAIKKKYSGMKSVKTTSGGHSNLQPTQGRRCREPATVRCDVANPSSRSTYPLASRGCQHFHVGLGPSGSDASNCQYGCASEPARELIALLWEF